MKVLVTGAAGFVGSEVVRALLRSGIDVLGLVRPGGRRERLEPVIEQIRVVEAPLEDLPAIDEVLERNRPDAVIHAAWYTRPADYRSSAANLDSLVATVRLAERIVRRGCPKLVGLGSCLEYRHSDQPHSESDPTDPASVYAATKVSAWLTIRALAAGSGTEVAWARLFHLHGPGEDPGRLLPRVTRDLLAGRAVDLSPGLQVRDHLHVSDAAEAIARLLQPDLAGIVNVCSGLPLTLRELLTIVGDLVGRPELLRFGTRPYLEGESMFLAGVPERLQAAGWRPRLDLREGLRDVVAAVRASVSVD